MNVGERIKALRDERKIQQKKLASLVGVNQATVSYWESGRQEPNPIQRKKLCEALGISEAELFGGIPSNINPEILAALQDPIAVKALLITFKNKQDIKNAIKSILECLPNLSPDKRQAIIALCK